MPGDDWDEPRLTSEQMLDQELAYRHDLEASIGIIVKPPYNRVELDGTITWGKLSGSLRGDPGVEAELRSELGSYADAVLRSNTSLPSTDRQAPTHRYEIPPAAQSWPDIAVMLWEQGKPILENLDLLLGVSLGVKEIVARTRTWFDKKNEEISELNRTDHERGDEPTHDYVDATFVLTQGAIVALVVADLVARFDYSDDLKIDTFPRGKLGYNDPAHPSPWLTYLVRCSFQGRVLVYVVTSSGDVREHFALKGDDVLPLPVPNLLSNEETGVQGVLGDNGLHLEVDEHA